MCSPNAWTQAESMVIMFHSQGNGSDPCHQPQQLKADSNHTYEEILQIENCTSLQHYDYFSGSGAAFALTFVGLGLCVPGQLGRNSLTFWIKTKYFLKIVTETVCLQNYQTPIRFKINWYPFMYTIHASDNSKACSVTILCGNWWFWLIQGLLA